ncbi:PD40 domain-containing protein [Marinifilum caeruleilacunae]|uniref:Tetratricopeptide repeat protein n=1 Tax=Marinifilum caeruleilacunae TaxID=2499076 RepID=A0ABX1WT09_9BACT|nr:PD40 domain-containing protein [Marinifilum caeruleilacunae]NOU59059.1 hypothetical protein [Marinifilum caeruleilacunae]
MKFKFTTLTLFFFVVFTNLSAQNLIDIKKSDYVDGHKERKNAYKKITTAAALFEKGEGYVREAIPLLLDAYQVNDKNSALNYNIGVSYLISGPRNEALPFLNAAQQLNPDVSEDIHFLLGMAHQYRNEFDQAIVQYKINIELIRQNKYKDKQDLILLSEKRIAECKNGKKLKKGESEFQVELLGEKVNTVFDEFNPISRQGVMYFSSRRGDEQSSRSATDQKYYEKIFKQNSEAAASKLPLNTPNKSNVGLMYTNDNDFVIYTGAEGNGDVYFSKTDKNKWTKGKALKFINESKSRESSVCFCKDEKEVYFVSDRKGGFGDCDIYYAQKNESGKWSKPMNLGGEINTEYDESDVFVNKDGSALYFSSRGHNTMGGYDIFKCERTDSGEWGRPKNLGFPINSTDNDITYFEDEEGRFYFASERSGGPGGFDIYREKQIVEKIKEPNILAEKAKIKEVPNELKQEKMSAPVMAVPVIVPNIPVKEKTVELEEIKMKQELVQEDFVYRVQIAACKREMGPADLFKRYKGGDVIEHLYVEGWHKYTIGGFETFDEAAEYRDSCGVHDAFVVIFKGGYRLGIAKKTGGVK